MGVNESLKMVVAGDRWPSFNSHNVALSSAGAGHGNYLGAKVFYPYTMLSAFVLNSITVSFMLLAVLQYPELISKVVYGCEREVAYS
jgi:hypothetical protein